MRASAPRATKEMMQPCLTDLDLISLVPHHVESETFSGAPTETTSCHQYGGR